MHIHIGTSGWHYEHWRGPSYPEDLLEINHSFYRLPSEDALQAWFVQTPAHFCFAVKASRYITHRKRLLDPVRISCRALKSWPGNWD
jgi:uncharacterized protein YecE (DUF72 family)